MYEKLCSSIPDVNAYLERLQLPAPEQPDLNYLDRLVYIHQQRIVFENMNSCELKKPVSLEIPALFRKIIIERRGGYCFELNALCAQLLKDMGYHTYGCMARIIRNKDFIPPFLHRINLAEIGGRLYFYDVGFGGPMPPCAMLVENGFSRTMHGETYQIEKEDDYWWTLTRITSKGEPEQILQFFTMPQDNVSFIPLNEYCASSPDSVFTQVPFLNRRTPDGSIGVMGNILTIVKNGVSEKREFSSKNELYDILMKYFDIRLPLQL